MFTLGLSPFGLEVAKSPSPPAYGFYYGELRNAIYDELHIRERTDVPCDNARDRWQVDTRTLFRFLGDLEGGNIANKELEVTKLAIKRRKINELDSVTLAYLPFETDVELTYIDNTQANDRYIYSIVPISDQLEGMSNEVEVDSDFTGYFVVDKMSGKVIEFDKSIGGAQDFETILNQDRYEIQTLNKYPHVYYSPYENHTLSLSTVLIPDDGYRSSSEYDKLREMIGQRIPLLVKSSTGQLFICDVHSPSISNPQNANNSRHQSGYDYMVATVSAQEIMDEKEYLSENIEDFTEE